MPSNWNFALPQTEKSGTNGTSSSSNDGCAGWLWLVLVVIGIIIVILIIWLLVRWARRSRGPIYYVDECGNMIGTNYPCQKVYPYPAPPNVCANPPVHSVQHNVVTSPPPPPMNGSPRY